MRSLSVSDKKNVVSKISENFMKVAFLGFFLFPIASSANSNGPLVSYPLIPHHVQQARRGLEHEVARPADDGSLRRRTAAADAELVGALYQGYGTHYVDLWCGTPPQRQTVIVDTGSGVTAFPCSECAKCGVPDYHIDGLFEEGDSTTFQKTVCASNDECNARGSVCKDDNCKITMSYSEGSRWDATLGFDKCYIGGPHEEPLTREYSTDDPLDPKHASHYAFDMQFGCQNYLNGLFLTQEADGIMGMNTAADSSYWSQMSRKLGTPKQFSLCFIRQPTEDEKAVEAGFEAGALTMGGTDTRLHSTEMVYSSGATDGRERRWSVTIRKIFFRDGKAGESAVPSDKGATILQLDLEEEKINQGGIIVDSGSTDTYFIKQLAPVFKETFFKLTNREYSNSAWTLTEEEFKAMPTLILQLASNPDENQGKDPNSTPGLAGNFDKDHPYDVLVAVPPSHYLEYKAKTGKYTPRIYVSAGGHSTLGANVIMGHDVLFDADNNRLGWAESSCDYSGLVKQNGFDFPNITGELKEAAEIASSEDKSFFESDSEETHREEAASDDDVDAEITSLGNENEAIDCHEELIDRSQNLTSRDRFQNETFVAMCKVKKGYSEFMDYCDSPECRVPVIVGLVIALFAGMCFCKLVKCFCFYLFCCCCCRKNDGPEYQPVDTEGIELVDGSGYKDEPSDEGEEGGRSRFLGKKKSQFRDKVTKKKKKESFKGDFKDFI